MKIKAVIPASGLGTRFLPATKSVPKEMFPILNTPIIELLVQELADAGVCEIIITISKNKKAIKNHFSKNKKLQELLNGNRNLLSQINAYKKYPKIKFVYVNHARGVADAIYHTKHAVGKSPFVLLYGDEIFDGKLSATKQLLQEFYKSQKSVLGYQTLKDKNKICLYGNIKTRKIGNINYLSHFKEKPKQEEILSSKVAIGKYILTSQVFDFIKTEIKTFKKAGKTEADFGNVVNNMAKQNLFVVKYLIGKRFDTGSKHGFALANLHFLKKEQKILSSKS